MSLQVGLRIAMGKWGLGSQTRAEMCSTQIKRLLKISGTC